MKNITKAFYAKKELTKKEREQIGAGDIRINRIQCLKCGDIITSDHRHDFNMCKCGGCGVDGGSWYQRRLGDNYKELSEYYNETNQKICL